jgi:hypothetical protein
VLWHPGSCNWLGNGSKLTKNRVQLPAHSLSMECNVAIAACTLPPGIG